MARQKPVSLTALVLLSWLAVSSYAFRPLAAQKIPQMRPAAGRFLVANRRMRDPRFVKSVILLVRYGEKGALGLIVNQPSGVKLAELIPEAEQLKDRDDTVYIGGPVAQDGMMMMLRAENEPEGAEHVFADVYVSPSRDVLDRLVANGADNFRSYVGYSGWAPGQLDHELERQDWHVTPGDADVVFSPAPASVWDKLIKQTDVLFAGGTGPRFPPRGETGKPGQTELHGLARPSISGNTRYNSEQQPSCRPRLHGLPFWHFGIDGSVMAGCWPPLRAQNWCFKLRLTPRNWLSSVVTS